MKSKNKKPALLIKQNGEKDLSSKAFAELLTAVLNKDCSFRFKAKGFSMHPFIKDDDVITVSPLNKRKLSLGDIIAAYHVSNDTFMVHRLVKKNGNYYSLKGDNNPEADDILRINELIGRVTHIERDGKRKCLSLGVERRFIAWLNQKNLLVPLMGKMRSILKGTT